MRVRYSLNNNIRDILDNKRLVRLDLIEKRRDFSAMAKANKRQVSDGFAQMYVHQVGPNKMAPTNAVWDELDNMYATLHSINEGSIFDFLTTLLCSGFRIFPTAGDAVKFRLEKQLAPLNVALLEGLGESADAFSAITVQSLYDFASKSVRGKGTETSLDGILGRCFMALCGKTSSTNEHVQKSADALGKAICAQYDQWTEMTSAPLEAAPVIAQGLGLSSQSADALKQAFAVIENTQQEADKAFSKATITYDHDLPTNLTDEPNQRLIFLSALYAYEAVKGGGDAKQAPSMITTQNGNGLSWLLNKGLSLFVDSDAKYLADNLNVPTGKAMANLERVINAAKRIHCSSIFGAGALKDSRSALQGFIDSTLANHINRTSSSLGLLQVMQDDDELLTNLRFDLMALDDAHCETNNINKDLLINTLDGLRDTLSDDLDMANVLVGKSETAPNSETVSLAKSKYDKIRAKVAYLSGSLNYVNNTLRKSQLTPLSTPDSLKVPIAIFNISSTLFDISSDRATLNRRKVECAEELANCVRLLTQRYKLTYAKSVDSKAAELRVACQSTKKTALRDPRIAAQRFQVSRLFNAIYRCSGELRQMAYKALKDCDLTNSKLDLAELKEHLFARKHFAFVSPYDLKPKKLLRLNEVGLENFNPVAFIDELFAEDIHDADRVTLTLARNNILLDGLETVSVDLIDSPFVRSNVFIDQVQLLEQAEITGGQACAIINNCLSSAMSGINYQLNKKRFSHNLTFKHLVGNRLHLVPKQTTWRVPPQLMEGRYQSIFSKEYIVFSDKDAHEIDTHNSLKGMVKHFSAMDEAEQKQALWLVDQLPMRWFLKLDVEGFGITEFAVQVDEGQLQSAKTVDNLVPIKLSGRTDKFRQALTSLYKNGKASPPTITFERQYIVTDKTPLEDVSKRRVVFNIPINTSVPVSDEIWTPSYILGIDPTEMGVGLGLIDLEGNLIDAAYVHSHELENYQKANDAHVTRYQPRQQYKRQYSNHLEQCKDRAVGELCNIIDNLMLQCNAIPVFEMQDSTAKGPHVNVWGAVIANYTIGENDAQNAERRVHFNGSNSWITSLTKENGEPLIVYPGAKVGGAGNSQMCPYCQRNVIQIAKTHLDSDAVKRVSLVDGKTVIGGHAVTLYTPDSDTMLERKDRGLNPDYTRPNRTFNKVTANNVDGKAFLVLVKRSIRRGAAGRDSKLSTISQWHCAFDDCNKQGNSDAFAGINIARKYVEKVLQ